MIRRRGGIEYPDGHRPAGRAPYPTRIWALLLVAVLVFGVLAGRLFQLQVVDGPQMRQAAERINTRTITVPATRGRILAADGTPLVVIAGKEYGTGSSRDWAAKGTNLLGVRAVIAESFERIHRSNLVGMGVLPLQFLQEGWQKLNLTGEEIVTIRGLSDVNIGKLRPRQDLWVELFRPSDGKMARFPVRCRIDNQTELDYFKAGGVMPYVLRNLARGPETAAAAPVEAAPVEAASPSEAAE